jgi:hypothetical protein
MVCSLYTLNTVAALTYEGLSKGKNAVEPTEDTITFSFTHGEVE